MAVDFRLGTHAATGVKVVDILVDGEFAGVIYPNGEKGIKLMSAHFTESSIDPGFAGEVIEDDNDSWPPIPAFLVQFDPSPYTIIGNRVVKIDPEITE